MPLEGERDPWGSHLDDTIVLILSNWAYEGTGYAASSGAVLALVSADRARAHGRAA